LQFLYSHTQCDTRVAPHLRRSPAKASDIIAALMDPVVSRHPHSNLSLKLLLHLTCHPSVCRAMSEMGLVNVLMGLVRTGYEETVFHSLSVVLGVVTGGPDAHGGQAHLIEGACFFFFFFFLKKITKKISQKNYHFSQKKKKIRNPPPPLPQSRRAAAAPV
jgi:hypothetical protein